MDREHYFAWLALKRVDGIGDVLYGRLLEKFGSPRAVFAATEPELFSVEGIRHQTVRSIRAVVDSVPIETEMNSLEQHGVHIITIQDRDYPERLKQIHDPPPLLFLKGKLRPEDHQSIAVVGSRHCSEYGRAIAHQISQQLALRGFTIISGLARGIDASAHEGALKAGGRTLGILGCGVDVRYPPEHDRLKEAISKQGAIISEFSMGTAPEPKNFPKRNRVIGGMSLGVIVVEAAQKSGALVTAACALEQGREVFAVPGPIGSKTSVGTHRLIKQGAKLVESVEDVLEELKGSIGTSMMRGPVQSASPGPVQFGSLNPKEKEIYHMLSQEPQHIDALTVQAQLSASKLAGLLLQLELKGVIKQLAGHRYIRVD
jgi:DNA processing protein